MAAKHKGPGGKSRGGKPKVKVVSRQHTPREVFESPRGEDTFEPIKEQQTLEERQEYDRRRGRGQRRGFWARLLGR